MNGSPYILCVETGTDICSVGLVVGDELISLHESSDERDHARRIAVYTEEVLTEAGIKAADLSAVAVSKGPGSYTGLRIGVSFAKGLCYGLGIPLIGVGSLESLCELVTQKLCSRQKLVGARLATETNEEHTDMYVTNLPASATQQMPVFQKHFIPMIDARRMEVFGRIFSVDGRPLSETGAWIIDENSFAEYHDNGIYIFGSGAEKCRGLLPWARYIDIKPSARGMVRLAVEAFESQNFEDVAYFEPFYLKDFVITTSRKNPFAGTSSATNNK